LFRKLGEKGILDDELYIRAKLGALILMTAVGVPMIWMGEEFGEHRPLSEDSNKIDWTLLEHQANQDLLAFYRKLIALRTTNPVFASPEIDFFNESPESGVLCFRRFDNDGNTIVVALNLSDVDVENYAILNFPFEQCREVISGATYDAPEHVFTRALARRTGYIFVSQ
jgi:1,4-alpha-glucan branching enzyme